MGYYISVPFAQLLRFFYHFTGSYGVALILFTLAVKLVLLPFQLKSKKNMLRMNRLQPKMKELQEKYANNQRKLNEEMQFLYASEGLNPMGGCLWSMLPFPIIIALYSIIRQPLSRFMLLPSATVEEIRTIATRLGYAAGRASAYEEIRLVRFVNDHFFSFSQINGLIRLDYSFLGLDLTVAPGDVWKSFFSGGWPVIGLVLIPVISAALSFLQSRLATAGSGQTTDEATARTGKMMFLMMPLMSLYIGFTLPAALGVYWIANSTFQIVQDMILNRVFSKQMDQELNEREREKRDARVAKLLAARERQRQIQEKINQGEKTSQKKRSEKRGSSASEAGRVADRPYARGRSYDPEHYGE